MKDEKKKTSKMTNISGNSIQNRENCVKQMKKLSADLLVQAKKDFNNLYETKIKISLFSLIDLRERLWGTLSEKQNLSTVVMNC